MASYQSYTLPTGTAGLITRALFNFDAPQIGGANYLITGAVTVRLSDNFIPADLLGTGIYDELATSGTAETGWSEAQRSGIAETLDILTQFIDIDLNWGDDLDSLGGDTAPDPAEVGAAGASDITIALISRTDVDWVGFSGGGDDETFGYTGSAGDVYVNSAFLSNATFQLGSDSRTTLMHELLHSFGLSHPHSDYVGNRPVVTADYAATRLAGFARLGFPTATGADMYKEYFSIMSYDDQSVFTESHTPMILDVIALQNAYGEGRGTSGTGNDTIESGNAGYRVYFDKGGIDTLDLAAWSTGVSLNLGVRITGATHLVGVAMTLDDAENLATRDPAHLRWLYGEFEHASGTAVKDEMVGNLFANRLDGLAGNDRLVGLGGNDVLAGGAGSDVLAGGVGNDRLLGGAGGDTGDYGAATAGVVVRLSVTVSQNTAGAGRDTLASIENLFGSRHADQLFGNGLANVLKGQAAADRLYGLAGNDKLYGGGGNDLIYGGKGADVFVFDKLSKGGIDRIADFLHTADTLQLDNALFTRLRDGALAAANYRESTTGTAADANDFVLYNTRTGALSYDADGSGAGRAVQFATLWDSGSTHPSANELSPLDFLVV